MLSELSQSSSLGDIASFDSPEGSGSQPGLVLEENGRKRSHEELERDEDGDGGVEAEAQSQKFAFSIGAEDYCGDDDEQVRCGISERRTLNVFDLCEFSSNDVSRLYLYLATSTPPFDSPAPGSNTHIVFCE